MNVKHLRIDDFGIFTFGLVTITWIFFKSETLSDAVYILKKIASLNGINNAKAWIFTDASLGLDKKDFWMAIYTTLVFILVELIQRKYDLLQILNKNLKLIRWVVYYLLFFSILIFGFYGEATAVDFVYSQF